MRHYTREEMVRESGARPDELEELEAQGLLVPGRPWGFWSKREASYTEDQLNVLRWLVKSRRAAERAASPPSRRQK